MWFVDVAVCVLFGNAVFIGLSMGLCSFCVDIALETLNNWKFGSVAQVSLLLWPPLA